MIIDSKVYGGPCSCGREHGMETQMAVVESGCLSRAEEHFARCGISGYRVAVYDRNTYHAEGMVHISADLEVILDPDGLHADEHGVALLMDRLPREAEVLVAVGSGTIHDITRYCAYRLEVPFVSCPTAASVDGFCSSVAAMTWEGAKKTLTAVAPRLVLADLNVIAKAPLYLARSGFGDMIGKYIALTDWRIARILTGEFYCQRIADIMENATRAILDSAAGIAAGDEGAYEHLTYGLLLSGIAMQMMGNSRPASGSEHHLSHFFEITGIVDDTPYLMHGTDVVYSAVYTEGLREQLLAFDKAPENCPMSREAWETNIRAIYTQIADEVIALQDKMGWYNEDRTPVYAAKWDEIKAVLAEAPSAEEMKAYLRSIDMDISEFEALYGPEKIANALKFAKDLKDRFSVLWVYYDLMVH